MKRALLLLMVVVMFTGSFPCFAPVETAAAEAVESWKAEFNRLCGQSDNAADMSAEDLKKALGKCDELKPQLEALEATPRKIYLKRLQMCRNLFAYLLEGKEKK